MLYRPLSEIIACGVGRVLHPLDFPASPVVRTLPLFAASEPPGENQPQRGRLEPEDVPARLLVVEDDWFVSMDIESALTEAGYEVVEIVRSADEAVRAAIRYRPDLVLMDIRLIGSRDGVEAAAEIRKETDIPCLFVSAHDDAATRARAAPSRPAGWLMKPFLTQHLLDAVSRAIRGGGDEPEPA